MNLYAYKICFYFSGYFFKKLEKIVEILFVLSKFEKNLKILNIALENIFLNENQKSLKLKKDLKKEFKVKKLIKLKNQ